MSEVSPTPQTMASPHHRPSLDITSLDLRGDAPDPPSPAPTYCSTFHARKDYTYPSQQASSSSSTTYTWEDEKPRSHAYPNEKSTAKSTNLIFPDDKSPHHSQSFAPKEEPHDPSLPHYASPIPPPTPYTPPPQPRKRRLPLSHFLTLLPWLLTTLFLLTTLWFISIALGIRLFTLWNTHSEDSPSFNVIINNEGATPVVSISSVVVTPTSTRGSEDNSGNMFGVKPTPVVSGKSGEKTATGTATGEASTFVTVTTKG